MCFRFCISFIQPSVPETIYLFRKMVYWAWFNGLHPWLPGSVVFMLRVKHKSIKSHRGEHTTKNEGEASLTVAKKPRGTE